MAARGSACCLSEKRPREPLAQAAPPEPPTVGSSTVSIEPGCDPDTKVTSTTADEPSLVDGERAAEAIAPGLSLSDMMAKTRRMAATPSPRVPIFDPTKTRLSKPMAPRTALQWIDDQVPEPVVGDKWRARERVRAIVAGLLLTGTDDYHIVVYVRGANPPPKPIEVRPPALAVITWRPLEGTLAFVMLVGVGAAQHSRPQAIADEEELLRIAAWQATHMPPVPRHGEHEGMPGLFYILGVHLSQHRLASCEVEQFGPKQCLCSCTDCDVQAGWDGMLASARRLVEARARELARVMPTEFARQAAMRDNLCETYAEHRGLVEKLFMGDQHGFCQSIANKTAHSHGGESDNNHHQFNYLEFSAPAVEAALMAEDPKRDSGVWACEDGELYVALRWRRLKIWFNSQRTHQCLPAHELLQYACQPAKLRVHARRVADRREAEARACIEADPRLMGTFRSIEHAARFQSSLVGSTTFQQCSVTHQLMRAMRARKCETVLRGHGRVTPAEGMSHAKETSEGEEVARIRALKPGQRLSVCWKDGTHEEGVVVEVCNELLGRPRDIRVRVQYEGRVLHEHLAWRHWRVLES